MTCDSGRPCTRCVKRNIGHLCHDEVKEAKLKSPKREPEAIGIPPNDNSGEDKADVKVVEESHPMKPPSGPATYTTNVNPTIHQPAQTQSTQASQIAYPHTAHGTLPVSSITTLDPTALLSPVNGNIQSTESSNFMTEFSGYYDTSLFGLPQDSHSQFASEHTNSEFLVLSDFLSIIGSPNGTIPNTPNSSATPQVANAAFHTFPELRDEKLTPEQQMALQASAAKYTHHGSLPQSRAPSNAPSRTHSRRPSLSSNIRSTSLSTTSENPTAHEKFFLTAADPQLESPEDRLKSVINAKVEAGLMKPFNYVRGYARLQKYMDQNMSPDSRSRILAPLSTFRPAFRAIAKRLTDVDLILVEEAFERLLLDYDRVFTSMAVPACLWRRTGEIFRGNKEFAALLNLPPESLRDGKLAITELMAEDSAVNYWEKYGDIAFDGQQKAVLTSCLLQVPGDPKGAVVSCCFSFTIKRDRYNIPSCIVGNFIPISF